MKKTHIFGIIIIAIAVMIITITAGDASTYVTFREAMKMAAEGNNKKIHASCNGINFPFKHQTDY